MTRDLLLGVLCLVPCGLSRHFFRRVRRGLPQRSEKGAFEGEEDGEWDGSCLPQTVTTENRSGLQSAAGQPATIINRRRFAANRRSPTPHPSEKTKNKTETSCSNHQNRCWSEKGEVHVGKGGHAAGHEMLPHGTGGRLQWHKPLRAGHPSTDCNCTVCGSVEVHAQRGLASLRWSQSVTDLAQPQECGGWVGGLSETCASRISEIGPPTPGRRVPFGTFGADMDRTGIAVKAA